MRQVAFSVLVAFHREGSIALSTLESIDAALRFFADREQGLRTEVVATLDNGDDLTRRVLKDFKFVSSGFELFETGFGDLGEVRNFAVSRSSGEKILIVDGDDLISPNFIYESFRAAASTNALKIFHPELVIYFGAKLEGAWQTASSDKTFDKRVMAIFNPWTSCCFGSRRIFERRPYSSTASVGAGFGFEDWHWNCETISLGFEHEIVPETIHFVRKKMSSMSESQVLQGAMFPRTSLFEPSSKPNLSK